MTLAGGAALRWCGGAGADRGGGEVQWCRCIPLPHFTWPHCGRSIRRFFFKSPKQVGIPTSLPFHAQCTWAPYPSPVHHCCCLLVPKDREGGPRDTLACSSLTPCGVRLSQGQGQGQQWDGAFPHPVWFPCCFLPPQEQEGKWESSHCYCWF